MRENKPSQEFLALPSSALTMGTGQRVTWGVAIMLSLSLAAFVVFGVAKSTADLGENSPLAQKYTDVAEAQTLVPEQATFDTAWGNDGGTTTLVLYDTAGSGSDIADAETHGIVAANLATHFGKVQATPMVDYVAGDMANYDGVVYVGATAAGSVSPAFHEDMLSSKVPVLWVGNNIADVSASDPRIHDRFAQTYGWDPVASQESGPDDIDGILYKDQVLTRFGAASGPIMVPEILDQKKVEVVATTTGTPAQPWAIRSGNLTYIGENPLSYVDETNRYLIFADLYFDLLAPDTVGVKQAAVRLEDVDAAANPDDLYAITDYLHERAIPFQVAVIPIRISTTPGDSGSWTGLSLKDRPDVVKALRYMAERGGTLIQHGTTHQYGKLDNPYNGSSGADFEFYRSECSSTPGPTLEIEPCKNESYVVDTGPVGPDTVDGWVERLQEGRDVFTDLGLGEVNIFETPHYLASSNAYAAMAKVYDYRYERSHYFPGQLSGTQEPYQQAMDQFFPYKVRDIYGIDVLPENLGNITEEEQNNHAVRDPAFLVAGAKANLVVRESTASFFYHPFLGVEPLKETIEGVEELGYTFVPATELK